MLRAGNLALIPTETVYGVGVAVGAFATADPSTAPLPPKQSGYQRIFSLKQRELAQTVPWLVAGEEDLEVFGRDAGPAAHALARAFWPGALTIVVKASSEVPAFMRAADGTVALRASASPVVQGLIRGCGSPLAVTSANTHGAPAPASFEQIEHAVLQGVDVAIDAGTTPWRVASTIVSVADGAGAVPRIIREGALTREQIQTALDPATAQGRSS